jgi:hypothetical protein
MDYLCDTCEKDQGDCKCLDDLIEKFGYDKAYEITMPDNNPIISMYDDDDTVPFCRICGSELDEWDQACDCGGIIPWQYDSMEE